MASIAQRRRERLTASKAKRNKILMIVGICALLVLLGIQLPKTLDLLKSSSPAVPAAPTPTPVAPATTEPETPPEALKLLRSPSGSDPFVARTLASGDPAPADVPWPPGARDPFVRARVATVIAPKRIIIGTPVAGRTPTVGYIVVLASIRTDAGRAVAQRIAARCSDDGLSPVGVLDSSTRRPLRAGYYVAYAGPYASGC